MCVRFVILFADLYQLNCSLLILFHFSLVKYHWSHTIIFFALSAYYKARILPGLALTRSTHINAAYEYIFFLRAVGFSARFVYTSYKFTVHKTQFTEVCTTELIWRLFKIQINLTCMKYEIENDALSL